MIDKAHLDYARDHRDEIDEMRRSLLTTVEAADSTLLRDHSLERYAELLDGHRVYGNYASVPSELDGLYERAGGARDPGLVEAYHKLVLLLLLDTFPARFSSRNLPDLLIPFFYEQFDRILEEMRSDRPGRYVLSDDEFLKDLGICRLKLYPCGAEVVDELGGIPRRTLVQGGVRRLPGNLWFFLTRQRGFKPCYEFHLHTPLKKHFSEPGWRDCYLRVAELLRRNPTVKGIMYTTWWLDPVLETISPRLNYLRELPIRHGGRLFLGGPSEKAVRDATAKSMTRRRLFERGEYVPQLYTVIWPRRDLLRWAEGAEKQLD